MNYCLLTFIDAIHQPDAGVLSGIHSLTQVAYTSSCPDGNPQAAGLRQTIPSACLRASAWTSRSPRTIPLRSTSSRPHKEAIHNDKGDIYKSIYPSIYANTQPAPGRHPACPQPTRSLHLTCTQLAPTLHPPSHAHGGGFVLTQLTRVPTATLRSVPGRISSHSAARRVAAASAAATVASSSSLHITQYYMRLIEQKAH